MIRRAGPKRGVAGAAGLVSPSEFKHVTEEYLLRVITDSVAPTLDACWSIRCGFRNESYSHVAESTQKQLGDDVFDAEFYLETYADIREAGIDPYQHYLNRGWREGRDPSADFDTKFYIARHLWRSKDGACPLLHYDSVGKAGGLVASNPNPDGAKGLFDAGFYLETYADVREAGIDPYQHYLNRGWREGRDPSADFDTKFYITEHLSDANPHVCPLLHYNLVGWRDGLDIKPAPEPDSARELFDAEFYLHLYRDVRDAWVDPYQHYLTYGWREGRNPSPYFDTRFYIRTHLSDLAESICPLSHYAQIGRHKNLATNEFDYFSQRFGKPAEDMGQLLRRVSEDPSLLTEGVFANVVAPMFSAQRYRKDNDLSDDITDLECLFRYLVFDFDKGKGPAPFFDGGHYAKQIAKRGGDAPPDPENSYLHWLQRGVRENISPAPWFDEGNYVGFNADLEGYADSLFMHLIRHGIREGRRFHPVLHATSANHPLVSTPKIHEFIELAHENEVALEELDANLTFWRSETMTEICQRTIAIEPEIKAIKESDGSFVPPWHDDRYRLFEAIRGQVEGQYDNIVLMPFCKLGGADFVAGVLAGALSQTGKTIVLRTDQSDWARPDWFPSEVPSVNLAPWLQPVDVTLRKRALYEVVRKLKPKHVFNVNSRLAFEMFETYGARLSTFMNLYAYYFCADRDADGREVGYPVTHFAGLLKHLTSALIDTQQLVDTLSARYSLPNDMCAKLSVMYTPAMSDAPGEPVARAQTVSASARERPVILWAGRFDRQKRFDLLVAVARAMPDVSFRCWGAAVLDSPPLLADMPTNLEVNPPFSSYDELPLSDCDGYLYTSAWDGLPTILIELGALGMPIVASAVGGVPELIDGTTGWPVNEEASIDGYVAAIKEMLQDPDERMMRATALQERVRAHHGRAAYLAKLHSAMGEGQTG